ncbi:sigma-E factor negative regulatory protein [Aquabacterium sp. J223]|uniref:sigma-E factor negative regulatory protein n=1 Tax=Aquabacterium sp. J223 TaxID=2898431 RepID=UPI0021ADE64C|nr:sigma-E factor negative regulatory protein [Aquabacterium sp. J223]UUX96794.1 sigma-E factor negative regulatory protein [Aquabacterium sp. J223]
MLSALVDGEADDAALRDACDAWASDDRLRERWHCYQLIGDVLRSDDLGAEPAHDEVFLRRLRERLADEPVVLAPSRAPLRLERLRVVRRRWMATTAVAAGFVAVAGVTIVTRLNAPQGGGPVLAGAPAGAAPQVVSTVPAADAAVEAPQLADGKLIRDARLDRYFAAHRPYGADLGRNAAAQAVPARNDR